MRKFFDKYFPLIPVALILASTFFSHSCANTSKAPTGGKKDTIPPVIVRINPESYVIGVPVEGAEFEFTFDEYVKVSDAKNIFLSPPQDVPPKYQMKGKTLVVSFTKPLEENTTYTLSLSGAIQDNNENNPFAGYTYVFSTGETIDSLMLTGLVQDCSTLDPVKNATVLLYKSHDDSAVFNQRPYAAIKTDDWGFFCIRNIQDTFYRIYAIEDKNNNNLYDPDEETVAFIDSLVRPVNVVRDSIYELAFFDMKDTVACRQRKTEYELSLFRETPSRQYIRNSGRNSERGGFLSFNAHNAHIDTMWIPGISADRLITQINLERDSLEFWINDRRSIPDTVLMFVNYMKTDSLGMVSPFTEERKLVNPNPRRTKRFVKEEISHKDTICDLKFTADPATVEQDGFSLVFTNPIINADFDSIRYTVINPRNQEEQGSFRIERDSLDYRKYSLRHEGQMLAGYVYRMILPQGIFRDINNFTNDSTAVEVSLPMDDNLSSLQLQMSNVNDKYIVELLDGKRSKVFRQYVITSDALLNFPYLDAGEYYVRITEDKNRNSFVDSGSLLEHRMPEKVKYLKVNDNSLLDIPASSVIVQKVDISQIF